LRLKRALPWTLLALALAVDVALFNVYPFYCEPPWSPNLLVSSVSSLKIYALVALTHFALTDLAIAFIPLALLWSLGKRVRVGILFVTSLTLLIALDALTIALIDYVALFWLHPPGYALNLLPITIAAIAVADTVYRLIAFPAVFPLAMLEACTKGRGKLLSYASLMPKRLALLATLNVATTLVVARLVSEGINLAIAELSPLAVFTYFRCFNEATAKLIAQHLRLGTAFTPTLQTWGGLVSEALCICVACLVAYLVSRGVDR